jgi:NAD(P)-dependent dehydrogenase (short-subunit alcohol dehydrogenase family)
VHAGAGRRSWHNGNRVPGVCLFEPKHFLDPPHRHLRSWHLPAPPKRGDGSRHYLPLSSDNAGVNTEAAALLETSDNEFERVLNVNLRGVWNCMKGELRQMLAQGSGAIVNCSSIGGLKGSRGRSAYSASKHAVIGLTRSAALDYAAKGIRINAVCPGMVNTPMAASVTKNYDPEIVRRMVAQKPIGRFGEPEEIAAAVVWLCSPAASFMVGHAMTVDGGLLAGRPRVSDSKGSRS